MVVMAATAMMIEETLVALDATRFYHAWHASLQRRVAQAVAEEQFVMPLAVVAVARVVVDSATVARVVVDSATVARVVVDSATVGAVAVGAAGCVGAGAAGPGASTV